MKTKNQLLVVLTASLAGCGTARTCVTPGETVTMPTPISNATETGEPGGDTISTMKLVVISKSRAVTQARESVSQSIAPGESKTFTPSFVVNPEAKNGEKINLTLHVVSPDAGIDPDPDSRKSDWKVRFVVRKNCEPRSNHSVERPAVQ